MHCFPPKTSFALLTGVLVLSSLPVKAQESKPFAFAEQIESIVNKGIEAGEMPGAVVTFASRSQILFQRAYGDRQVEPTRQPMTVDTVFDLASLTKPIATGTSVMLLIQSGKVELEQPVSEYLPEFAPNGKDAITVKDLLLHIGGLIPDNALRDYQQGQKEAWHRICQLSLRSPPGDKFAYTDVGFIVLGELVHRVSGLPLDQFAQQNIFQPLEMDDTTFNPTDDLIVRAAPTEKRGGDWIKGEVHDPRAHLMDGVAGHAGLFSTATDLVKYGQMMLSEGKSKETILNQSTFKLFTKPRQIPRGSRTFAWDHQSPYSSNRGQSFSVSAFGHGGFTGTVMWIDPEQERIFVFLSNRLHPDGKGSVNRLAGEIATLLGN